MSGGDKKVRNTGWTENRVDGPVAFRWCSWPGWWWCWLGSPVAASIAFVARTVHCTVALGVFFSKYLTYAWPWRTECGYMCGGLTHTHTQHTPGAASHHFGLIAQYRFYVDSCRKYTNSIIGDVLQTRRSWR